MFINTSATENDTLMKEKGKVYTDLKRNARKRDICTGDIVLMKNQGKRTKYDPNFDPRSLTVVSRKGNEILLNDEKGRAYKRNISQVQKFDGIIQTTADDSDEMSDGQIDDMLPEARAPEEIVGQQGDSEAMVEPQQNQEETKSIGLNSSRSHDKTPSPVKFFPDPGLTSTQVKPRTRLGRQVRKPAYLDEYGE